MYNDDLPPRAELPSAAQLIRSTVIAAGVAAALLVTVVLPSEYGIDPTGAGRVLGLTTMGEIKTQLAEEAEADRMKDTGTKPVAPATAPGPSSSLFGRVFAELVVGSAQAQEMRRDMTELTLQPGEAAEVKLAMAKDSLVDYVWIAEGGVVNFDLHGDGGGNEISYEKGRGSPGSQGKLVAAFDGNHGWFWRNRTEGAVTIKLSTNGLYSDIKRVM
jgi:hypothetical protein